MTKRQLELKQQIAELGNRHPEREGREWMPWATNDHPLAMEHWRLVHRLLDLRYDRPGRKLSKEERQVFEEGRKRRRPSQEWGVSAVLNRSQIDDQPPGGPPGHPWGSEGL